MRRVRLFNPYFKPKELLDETVGALGMYKPPFIKTEDELKQSQTGQQIAEILGKLAASGGPEVKAKIQEFIDSVTGKPGMEVGGGNGGTAGAIPVPPQENLHSNNNIGGNLKWQTQYPQVHPQA